MVVLTEMLCIPRVDKFDPVHGFQLVSVIVYDLVNFVWSFPIRIIYACPGDLGILEYLA